ncbi:hypothetical protein JXB01_01785 [Candidatus Micrarchaeota archaeon]|nr:hypothetical protein [Candidatus Micrarchaeota archaeon]
MIEDVISISNEPVKSLKKAGKKKDMNKPVNLLIFTGLVFLVGFLIQNIQSLSPELVIAGIATSIVLIAFLAVMAYFTKVPFEILSEDNKNSYYKSLVSVVYGGVVFSMGYLIYSLLILAAVLLSEFLLPLSAILILLGFAVVIYYALKAVSTVIKGYQIMFSTDYATILAVSLLVIVYSLILVNMVGLSTLMATLVTSVQTIMTQPIIPY